jgi:hypothetical protein
MSKPITMTIPHQLGVAEARRRIEDGFEQLGAQVPGGLANVQKHWTGDTMTFSAVVMGQTISGTLAILATAAHLEVLLPGLLGMIAGKIKGQMQKQGTLLLEKK